MEDYDLSSITMYHACLVHARADRVLRTLVNNQLDNFQITMMEWLLLGVIDEGPKDGITLSKIAEALDVSQPQVTALMDKVIDQKLVRQKIHKHDRRSRTAVLTIKGKRLLEKIEATVSAFMKEWVSEVPKNELESYAKIVMRIANYRVEGNK